LVLGIFNTNDIGLILKPVSKVYGLVVESGSLLPWQAHVSKSTITTGEQNEQKRFGIF
jgi:hypothetical protein